MLFHPHALSPKFRVPRARIILYGLQFANKACSVSLPTEIIDSQGDVDLFVEKKGKIRVSSKMLSMFSPVFDRMLFGQFKEALDFANSLNNVYELHLPEDNYYDILALCKSYYHRGELPPCLPLESCPAHDCYSTYSDYSGRKFSDNHFCEDSIRFREFVLTCDKYQSASACSLYISSYLDSLMSHCETHNTETHVCLAPFTIAECATIVRATDLYRRATKWLLRYGVARPTTYEGLEFVNSQFRSKNQFLPPNFERDIIYELDCKLEYIKGHIRFLIEFLTMTTTKCKMQPGFEMHGTFGPGQLPATMFTQFAQNSAWLTGYRYGWHDLMLLSAMLGKFRELEIGPFDRSEPQNVDRYLEQANLSATFLADYHPLHEEDATNCNACFLIFAPVLYSDYFRHVESEIDGLELPRLPQQ
ncbi:hypothetical protein BT63DRAFT_426361 [Microthyrium microscopicum]|uniref:BTB domain-containing protein n=1 Tax=Microthyrium microscopicum TaxID=703497 RepID=A0A6A6U5D4_9PEZI|nr:hypothetical protein BT63DRAFT_426361 [Microthyrium microscopicum]